jgi:hypothetical protein
MVALPLFDIVLSSSANRGRSADIAAQLVNSALGDLDQIEKLDESLAPEDPFSFDRQMAALVRGMYERWAQDAESLLERVGRVEKQIGAVAAAQRLRNAHGRTRAMLSISLEQVERGLQDVAKGRTMPMEEVRRELRLRVQ